MFMPLNQALGQIDVTITDITPYSFGHVGDTITITGIIPTFNGEFRITLGGNVVVTNNSAGNIASGTFKIPEMLGGDYTLELIDSATGNSASAPFPVIYGYAINAVLPPSGQLQEGASVVLNITVTGARPIGFPFTANITVRLPDPLATNYSALVPLSFNEQTGTARGEVTFPSNSFAPSGAVTTYAGLYPVAFNLTATSSLVSDVIPVGFIDKTEYHRDETVQIRAIGYQANQNANINITNINTGATVHTASVTADAQGVITSSWTIPSNTPVSVYTIVIDAEGTDKAVFDSQRFSVAGYSSTFNAKNLAGEAVSGVLIQVLDQATNTLYNGTTMANGSAFISLELGTYPVSAFSKGVKVGETQVTVTGSNTFDIQCQLTNLNVAVKDRNSAAIPFVNLNLIYQYTSSLNGSILSGNDTGQTDVSGTFIFHSVLPNINYVVDASRYGAVFNSGNNTVNNLPAVANHQITILTPSRTLTLTTVDYAGSALPDARIELIEQESGVFYGGITNSAGVATFEVTFGQYALRTYAESTLLNTTIVDVFNNIQVTIHNSLYNLPVTVKVVDYFGQPISNVNVILNRQGMESRTATTQADGTVRFDNVIGGDMQITAYAPGKEGSYVATNLYVDSPAEIPLALNEYVALASLLIDTTALATLLIILAAILVLLGVEVFRRRGLKRSQHEK